MSDAAVLVIFCGGLFLIAGLLRLGFVAQFLSRPVMEGFVFGLAIFVTVSQLPKLFGIEKGSGDTIEQFVHVIGHLGDTSAATLAVGAGALVLLFAVERLAPQDPGRSARARAGDPRQLDLQPLGPRSEDRRPRAERAPDSGRAVRPQRRRPSADRGRRRGCCW